MDFYDKEAKELLKSENIDNSTIRELLVLAMHSSTIANNYFECKVKENDDTILKELISISGDFDDFGDAPNKASFFIKDYSVELLKPYENEMFNILSNDDRGARTFIAIALGKLKSEQAKAYILKEANDNDQIGNWIFLEALKYYQDEIIQNT